MRFIRIIRVFISSTFADMQRERTLLHKHVLPIIKDYCRKYGWDFEFVDLRWGITEEQADENLTLQICLNEIKLCQEISPRPNFLILAGERYGWIPDTDHIPIELWNNIISFSSEKEQLALETVYRLDNNAFPPELKLKSTKEVKAIDLNTAREAILKYGDINKEFRQQYLRSATESEIYLGLLNQEELKYNVGLYKRILKNIPYDKLSLFKDGNNRQTELVRQLEKFLPATNCIETTIEFNEYSNGAFDNKFCQDVSELLLQLVDREIQEHKGLDSHMEELLIQRKESEKYARNYPLLSGASSDVLKTSLQHYRITVIHGSEAHDSGALLSRVGLDTSEAIIRHAGISAMSSSGKMILCSIYREITEKNIAPDISDEELFSKMRTGLSVNSNKSLIILISNVDKLEPDDILFTLSWLPNINVAPKLKIVLAGEDKKVKNLAFRKDTVYIDLLPAKVDDIHKAIRKRLSETGRRITETQEVSLARLLGNAHTPLPQIFEVITNRCIDLKSWDNIPELINSGEELIKRFWRELTDPRSGDPLFAQLSLGLLIFIKGGITDEELLQIVALDDELYNRLYDNYGHRIVSSERKIPIALWSNLYFRLSPLLVSGTVGTGMYNTLRGTIVASSLADYLGESIHSRVLDLSLKYFNDEKRKNSNHALDLLPWLFAENNQNEQIVELLLDDSFCNLKIASGKIDGLASDIDIALKIPNAYNHDELLLRKSFLSSERATLCTYCRIAPRTFSRELDKYRTNCKISIGDYKVSRRRLMRQKYNRVCTAGGGKLLIAINEEPVIYCYVYDLYSMKLIAGTELAMLEVTDYPRAKPFFSKVTEATISLDGRFIGMLCDPGLVIKWEIGTSEPELFKIRGEDGYEAHIKSPVFIGEKLFYYMSQHWEEKEQIMHDGTCFFTDETLWQYENLFSNGTDETLLAINNYGMHHCFNIKEGSSTFSEIENKGELHGEWKLIAFDPFSWNIYVRHEDKSNPIGSLNLISNTLSNKMLGTELESFCFSGWASENKKLLAVITISSEIVFFNLDNGMEIGRISGVDAIMPKVIYLSDKSFLTIGNDVQLWEINT